MKTIVELAEKYDTDKKINNGIKCKNNVYGHNFAKHYDIILKDLNIRKMLEIGVSYGSSIKMWDEYFDKKTIIYGIDINENRFKIKNIETDNIKIFIGDQGNESFLQKFNEDMFDFIVDDGSHKMKDQQISLKILFKYLNSGGIYVIEDLHTSKSTSHYNSDNETTTLNLLLSLQAKSQFKSNYMTEEEYNMILNNIDEISFYENYTICFIKKS